jgi:hypothetical protein
MNEPLNCWSPGGVTISVADELSVLGDTMQNQPAISESRVGPLGGHGRQHTLR